MLAPRDRTTQVLLGAADLIEERGWCQGTAQLADGSICSARAIGIATGFDYGFSEEVGKKLLRMVGFRTVPGWNDETGRTKGEVVAVLRQAAFMAS